MSSAEESEPEDIIAVSQLESAKTDSPLKSIAQERKKKSEEGSFVSVHLVFKRKARGKRWEVYLSTLGN